MTPFLANWLWIQSSLPRHRRFLHTLAHVGETQRGYLLRLVRRNQDTEYGRRHRFGRIASVDDFRHAVPLTDYEDYLPYIEGIAQGKRRVLTGEPVTLFQPSSGTSSASKLIPYTRSLKVEFQRGIAPWVAALFRRRPELLRGRAYWSVTPPLPQGHDHGLIPVGFDEDAEYLGFLGRWLYRRVAAVPAAVVLGSGNEDFMRLTIAHLLRAEDLALVSVWSPTFLLVLLDRLREDRGETLRLVAGRRAGEVSRILEHEPYPFEAIWPHLAVISCWTDGASELYAKQVKDRFPHVEVQGKGLVATEAFVSLPLLPGRDPVLAVDSHFFEFQDTESGDLRLAHELRLGRAYSVVVTTGGGLYRYCLGDTVRVTGSICQAPTLRFVAREAVSDLFGEKLNPGHVQRSADAAFSECSMEPSFFLLAPVVPGQGVPAYTLFVHSPGLTPARGQALALALERRLCENFHYAHCRNIGQLAAVRVFAIEAGAGAPAAYVLSEMQRRGLKLGDIKPAVLDREAGWEGRFSGRFLDVPAA